MSVVINILAKKQMLDALIALGTVKAALMKQSYIYSAAHQFLSDLGANVRATVTPGSVTTNSPAAGTVDCADHTFTTVSGDFLAVWYYVDTAVAGTSPLLFYNDAVAGFPGSVTGGDVLVTVDNGANRLFTL